jgi:hypothetical protein
MDAESGEETQRQADLAGFLTVFEVDDEPHPYIGDQCKVGLPQTKRLPPLANEVAKGPSVTDLVMDHDRLDLPISKL